MLTLTRPEGTQPGDLNLSRRSLGGLMFFGYAAAALSAEASPIVTPEEGLVCGPIDFTGWAPEGAYPPSLPAYVARPQGSGPFPVVIVVNEIFGLHAYIQDVCRRLARQGYAAMAPGYFARSGDPSRLTEFEPILAMVRAARHPQVMGDTAAALDWLRAQPWADADRAGITGFCWGGTVVWMAVADLPFRCGAAWYGRLVGGENAEPDRDYPADAAGRLRGPVLGLYAENDRGIPLESVETMRAALSAAGKADSEIIVYPGAQHGFHADYRATYDRAAAEDAWSRMLALFERELKAG
ncbi:dienelactone hydrolase family protein [Brevundimonas sp. 2R-24]|uniref:Dienelactone hydrolase family protein n=1 Tax=Peiella sedimenti TaxID=3061083 RepID=A0ABT8SNT6_9CAUL|nr:dienelactone hydrolase family protein [Caulobacteraceae bacterium XZ-24]